MFGPVTIGSATDTTRIEPFRIVFVVGVLFMDVVHNKVHHDPDIMIMGRFNKCVEFFFCAQFGFNSSWLRWPVSMESRDIVDSIRSFAGSIGCRVEG